MDRDLLGGSGEEDLPVDYSTIEEQVLALGREHMATRNTFIIQHSSL